MALAELHLQQQLVAADLLSVPQQLAAALSRPGYPQALAVAVAEQDPVQVFQLQPAALAPPAAVLLEAAGAAMLVPRSLAYLASPVVQGHLLASPQLSVTAIAVFEPLAALAAQAPPLLHRFDEFLRRYTEHEPYRR